MENTPEAVEAWAVNLLQRCICVCAEGNAFIAHATASFVSDHVHRVFVGWRSLLSRFEEASSIQDESWHAVAGAERNRT
jgi:hypothetical protein